VGLGIHLKTITKKNHKMLGLYRKPIPKKLKKIWSLGKNTNFLAEILKKINKKFGVLPKPNFFWVFWVGVYLNLDSKNPKKSRVWVKAQIFWVFWVGDYLNPDPKTQKKSSLGKSPNFLAENLKKN
jgi:hypothetical protein